MLFSILAVLQHYQTVFRAALEPEGGLKISSVKSTNSSADKGKYLIGKQVIITFLNKRYSTQSSHYNSYSERKFLNRKIRRHITKINLWKIPRDLIAVFKYFLVAVY